MTRPTDWSPLYDSDPTPGDPYEVAELGAHLRSMADMIDEQSRNIEALSSVEGWDSDAGRAFNEVADGTAGRLKKAFERYDEAAKAIGTKVREDGGESSEYASELRRAQQKADKALGKYRTAHGDYEEADREIDKLLKKCDNQPLDLKGEDHTEYVRWTKKKSAASEDMRTAAGEIRDARGIFDDAGDKAAKHIKNVVHHDGVHDPGGFWNTLADWADAFSNISAVLGILATICAFVPPLQFLAPIFATLAVITSALALAGHIYDMTARGGKFDLLKLGVDVLGIMPGLGAIKGFKALPKAGKLMKSVSAIDGIGHNFFNGIAVKSVNFVFTKGAKLAGKTVAPIAGKNITAVIKGASLGGLIYKLANHHHSSSGTPNPTPGPIPRPSSPPSTTPHTPTTPSPTPQPSPKPFHAALAA